MHGLLRAGRERVAVCLYPSRARSGVFVSVCVSECIRPQMCVCVCVCVRLRSTWKASTEGQVRGSPRMLRLKHMGIEGRGGRKGGRERGREGCCSLTTNRQRERARRADYARGPGGARAQDVSQREHDSTLRRHGTRVRAASAPCVLSPATSWVTLY